jgi:hypothetical protein
MPTAADSECISRDKCNKLLRRVAKLSSAGKPLVVSEEEIGDLSAPDQHRLRSFLNRQLQLLAAHSGRLRVDVPGPGKYHDGLRQGSAALKSRRGEYVPKFAPAINTHTDDLRRQPSRPQDVVVLPPLPPSPRVAAGPTLSARHWDQEAWWRRQNADRAPNTYRQEIPKSTALPVTLKSRVRSDQLIVDSCQKPGPATYVDREGAFPAHRPPNSHVASKRKSPALPSDTTQPVETGP